MPRLGCGPFFDDCFYALADVNLAYPFEAPLAIAVDGDQHVAVLYSLVDESILVRHTEFLEYFGSRSRLRLRPLDVRPRLVPPRTGARGLEVRTRAHSGAGRTTL